MFTSIVSYVMITINTVPTSQSVMQPEDNQPKQDDKSSHVKGLYVKYYLNCINYKLTFTH